MGEVIEANIITKLDISVERVLRKAQEAELSGVVVIGWDKDGELYTASSMADGGDMLWMLEMTKKKLLEIGDGC